MSRRRNFSKAVFVIVTILGAWNTAVFLKNTSDSARAHDPYDIAGEADRVSAVAAALGPVDKVGYIDGPADDDFAGETMYLRVRYLLGPRLVVRGAFTPPIDWVVGGFTQPVDLDKFCRDYRLRVVHDYGGGVVLFRSGSTP
jgi:hypothetical protein